MEFIINVKIDAPTFKDAVLKIPSEIGEVIGGNRSGNILRQVVPAPKPSQQNPGQ